MAADIRSSVPEPLYDAAHSPELAYLLAVALALDRSGATLERQLSLAEHRLGRERATLIRSLYDELAETGAEYRLPLMQVAFPSLRRRPLPQLEYLVRLASDLIEVDGDVDLYEYCFYRMLVANYERAGNPSRTRRRQDPGRERVRKAAIDLLAILARHGNTDDSSRQQAFHAGAATFGSWSQRYAYDARRRYPVRELDGVLDLLLALNGEGRQMLLKAVTATVLADGRLALAEAELLRAVCTSLDCPMPPVLLRQPVT